MARLALSLNTCLISDCISDFLSLDKELIFDGETIEPMITYGTNPGMGMSISKGIPNANSQKGGVKTYLTSLEYMNYSEGESMLGKKIDFVFKRRIS